MVNKRGSSHIEVVLSLILFIVFVGFAVYFFNPVSGDEIGIDPAINALERFEKLTENKTERYSVSVEDRSNFQLGQVIEKIRVGGSIEGNSRVENLDGNVLRSQKIGEYVNVENPEKKEFYYIHIGEDFVSESIGEGIEPSNYQVSSRVLKDIISEREINKILEEYDSDYESLKGKLEITPNLDFIIEVDLSGNRLRPTKVKTFSEGSEVFSREIRREVLKIDGRREFADIRVFVW